MREQELIINKDILPVLITDVGDALHFCGVNQMRGFNKKTGTHFTSSKYKKFKEDLTLLTRSYKLTNDYYGLLIKAGTKFDIDNFLKPVLDVVKFKLGVDDQKCLRLVIDKYPNKKFLKIYVLNIMII